MVAIDTDRSGWARYGRPSTVSPSSVFLVPSAPLLQVAPVPITSAPRPQPADPLLERDQRFHPVWSSGGMVASDEPLASAAGRAVLRQGGNALDAAVASAFALAVTLPLAGFLGGGGFLVWGLPGRSPAAARGCVRGEGAANPERRLGLGTAVAVNFREMAPLAARAGMFLTPGGQLDRQKATRSLASTAVPGTVAGLVLAQRCYGRLPLQQVLAPAIDLAERGFPVSLELSDSLLNSRGTLQGDPGSRSLFFRASPTGLRPLAPGEHLKQPQLAASLGRIAAGGAAGFYGGPVAASLLQLMGQRGGLIQRDDLSRYRARLVPPLMGRFRGYPVLTMPPPGGGLTLLQLLALLEPYDLAAAGHNGAASLHRLIEAMNLAFRDRNARLGDPDQQAIPVDALLGKSYLASLRLQINPRRHQPAARLGPAPALPGEGTHTTHLSVADRQGGVVALTTTLNFPYGNGVLVPGGGFLLNNEMDDFSAAPGQANAFGLVQGPANRIAPGRRPLSSMAPTLVLRRDDTPWLATGSPGGSRIITTVAQVLLNRIVYGLNLATAVSSPRLHSQLWPDQFSVEEGFSPDTLQRLEVQGHHWRLVPALGAANSVEVLAPAPGAPGGTYGVADPRRAGGPAVGE